MAQLKDFITQAARPLPVIILADVSGSMAEGNKIKMLNTALKEMLDTFGSQNEIRADIFFAMITFGGNGATLHTDFGSARLVKWTELNAAGGTPMGSAFNMLREMLEDQQKIPSRSYRPTIVLVSDGAPTDNWQAPLQQLKSSPRASKAFRFAMGIGSDADTTMLQAFLDNPEQRVFTASDARDISKFFRFVTMSVTTRSRSQDPNQPNAIPDIEDTWEDIEF